MARIWTPILGGPREAGWRPQIGEIAVQMKALASCSDFQVHTVERDLPTFARVPTRKFLLFFFKF